MAVPKKRKSKSWKRHKVKLELFKLIKNNFNYKNNYITAEKKNIIFIYNMFVY